MGERERAKLASNDVCEREREREGHVVQQKELKLVLLHSWLQFLIRRQKRLHIIFIWTRL